MEEDKKALIEKAASAGLGNKKFLEGVSVENLQKMVKAVEDRDGEIILLKKNKLVEVEKGNITTLDDLIKAKRIKVRPVVEDEEEKPQKAEKDENKA